jgi:hypothetical protein
MIKHTEEFKQEAVRIALTSGLPRDRVASDLGIPISGPPKAGSTLPSFSTCIACVSWVGLSATG